MTNHNVPLAAEDATGPEPRSLPISGKFVLALIGQFCEDPFKGNDAPVRCSIGVAERSIVATDGYSAVVVGEPGNGKHEPTHRKEARLLALRAAEYGHAFEHMETPTKEGIMPDVSRVVDESMRGMESLGRLPASVLAQIGRLASAAGERYVELYADGKRGTLGFQFDINDIELRTLFTESGPVTVRGVAALSPKQKVGE